MPAIQAGWNVSHSASNGPVMYGTTGDRVLGDARNGHYMGRNFRFSAAGDLIEIEFFSEEGVQHGPEIFFKSDGSARPFEWHVNGKKVNAAEYAAATATDPTLPPYYADTKKYNEFLDAEVKARLEKYRKMPRVKIPLEFDQAGNLVPAQ